MELKLYGGNKKSFLSHLLIVPYGIETLFSGLLGLRDENF